MKNVFFNELRHLTPHIREQFLKGERQYRDQEEPVRFETDVTHSLYAGLLKHQGGVRFGALHHIKDKAPKIPEHLLRQIAADRTTSD